MITTAADAFLLSPIRTLVVKRRSLVKRRSRLITSRSSHNARTYRFLNTRTLSPPLRNRGIAARPGPMFNSRNGLLLGCSHPFLKSGALYVASGYCTVCSALNSYRDFRVSFCFLSGVTGFRAEPMMNS